MHAKLQGYAHLLGVFSLTDGLQSLDPLLQTRQQMVLAYLMLHDQRPQLRKHVAFLFWPDTTEERALANLRHTLHHLRKTSPILNDHL